MTRFLKTGGIIFLIIYIIGCTALYFIQDDIIFRPTPLNDNTSYRWGQEVYIDVAEGIQLHGLYQQRPGAKGAILYLHGNRGNTRWCQRQAESFDGYGMDVLLIDYRGYGKSDGEIESMSQLEGDMDKVYHWLANKYPEGRIWIAGYSLGSGLASYLADTYNSESLMLIAPYVSIEEMKDEMVPVVPDFLIKYPLNNEKYLKTYKGNVAIFHGTEDEVIPYHHSEELQKIDPQRITLHTLEGTGHRGAIFDGSLRRHLQQLSAYL